MAQLPGRPVGLIFIRTSQGPLILTDQGPLIIFPYVRFGHFDRFAAFMMIYHDIAGRSMLILTRA